MKRAGLHRAGQWTAIVAFVAASILTLAPAHAAPVVYNVAYGADSAQVMDIYRTSMRSPAVIVVHGGGWSAGDKAGMTEISTALHEDGFTVFTVDYRLATNTQAGYPMQPQDIQLAISWVLQHGGDYGAQPNQVALLGASAGGNLVSLVAQLVNAATPGTVSAVVSMSGPQNFVTLAQSPGIAFNASVPRYLGYKTIDMVPQSRLIEASPQYQVTAFSPPVMLLNSQDEIVPLEQATDMATVLTDSGVQVTLITPTGSRHSQAYFSQYRPNITAFLRRATA